MMNIPWPLVVIVIAVSAIALIDTFLFDGAIAKAFDEADER